MEDILELLGIRKQYPEVKDYDDLSTDEQDTYRVLLDQVESAQLNVEDIKKHIRTMRQSIEVEVARMETTNPNFEMYRARQYVYVLLESVFDRPEKARDMLKNMQMQNKIKKLRTGM